jgi:PAS domain S-box-containing protein
MERTDLEQWKAREVARLLALVETERRYYQEIVASVPVGLVVLAPDLSVVSSNREVRKICGLRSGEPVGPRLDELLPPTTFENVREVLNTGVQQNDLFVDTQEDPARRLRISIQSIRTWDDEKEQEALVTIQDISALPLQPPPAIVADEPAHVPTAVVPDSELLKTVNAIVWAAELPSMQFVYVNAKAQDSLGYPSQHWLNAPDFWSERIHPDDRNWVLKSYEDSIAQGSPHICEYRAQTSNGKAVWLRETARLLTDEQGQTKHLIGIAVEITQRKILDEQVIRSQRVDALGKLGTRVSHEIRNLLLVVSGYGEELIHGLPSSHPLHSDLQEILSATDRLRDLANQLSLFSRRPSSQASPVNLTAFVKQLQTAVEKALGDNVRLDLKMPSASFAVQADEPRLEQLIVALAQRARRDMRDGGTFTMEFSPFELTEDLHGEHAVLRPGPYVAISIEDDGRTLEPDARAMMFESLGTLRDPKDDCSAKDADSSDPALLGLLYGFVRQWGGDISVSANSTRGTVFQILLPRIGQFIDSASPTGEHRLEEAQQERVAEQPSPEPVAEGTAEQAQPPAVAEPEPVHETILIAEEDAGIRNLVKRILKRQHYHVLEAASAQDAIESAEQLDGKLDLLIADVTALQFDGTLLAKKITAQSPQTKVLYLSGYTDDPSAKSRDLPEHAACLQKPFTLGSLLTKVKEVLEPKTD